MTSVTLSESVTSIEDYAFKGCSSLTSVTLSENVTSIGYYAFRDCSSLTDITIPENVTSIEYYSFSNCGKLSIIFSGIALPDISNYAFAETTLTVHCYKLSEIDFWAAANEFDIIYLDDTPSTVENILTLPVGLLRIDEEAFASSHAEIVIIPSGCTAIGSRAFADNANLVFVHMPDSVTDIAEDAFEGCPNVRFVCESENAAADYAAEHGISCEVK